MSDFVIALCLRLGGDYSSLAVSPEVVYSKELHPPNIQEPREFSLSYEVSPLVLLASMMRLIFSTFFYMSTAFYFRSTRSKNDELDFIFLKTLGKTLPS